jgi:23S rRNA (guanine745-N1)-methyltransferase
MTPFAFKTTDSLLDDLKTRDCFTCQADFLIRLYKKTLAKL